MEFYINGDKIDASLEEEKTVGDVLQSFALEFEANKIAVIGISLNGKNVDADQFDEVSKEDLKNDMRFDFNVVTEAAVEESICILSDDLKELSKDTEQVPTLFINGKANEAHEIIKRIADAIDQFCHMTALASLFPNSFKITTIGNMALNDFFNDFSPILTDFENALEGQDTVLTGDLCEYEICPRLLQMSEALSKINFGDN